MTDDSHAYGKILGRNISAARGRLRKSQAAIARRMNALGFEWHQQTAGAIEKGDRRVTAEEILGLSLALEVPIAELMAPVDRERVVRLRSGETISVAAAQLSAYGVANHAISWDGDTPVFPPAQPSGPLYVSADASNAVLRTVWNAGRRLAGEAMSEGRQAGPSQPAEDRALLGAPGRGERSQAVIAAIVTSDRGVLVTRRVDQNPPWGFTAGWGEPGESPEDTIIREVKEEADLRIQVGEYLGERDHPATGKHMIYYAARPTHGTEIHLGDKGELTEVRWVSLAEADELMGSVPGGIYGPVREHLVRELGEG
jgi:8-oxo-dGTP diphosphatase